MKKKDVYLSKTITKKMKTKKKNSVGQTVEVVLPV